VADELEGGLRKFRSAKFKQNADQLLIPEFQETEYKLPQNP